MYALPLPSSLPLSRCGHPSIANDCAGVAHQREGAEAATSTCARLPWGTASAYLFDGAWAGNGCSPNISAEGAKRRFIDLFVGSKFKL